MRVKLMVSTALVSLSIATPAVAQSAEGATAEQADQSGLNDIIVTAQRREETSQKAAIAIDVVSPAELTRAGVATPSGLNAVAPSLYVARVGGANTSYFIRGVGNFTNNAYSDPAIAFSVNGVYLGRPTSTTGTFYDLERVEVLKGPQGTLYGRNATGGAINVLSQKPKLGEFSGYASAGYGNYDALDLEGAINIPIGTQGAFRLSGKLVNQDGFNDDGTYDDKGEALRGQLLVDLNDALTMRVIADYSHTGGAGAGADYVGTLNFAPGAPASGRAPANYVFAPAPASLRPFSGLNTQAADAYHSTFVIGGSFNNPSPLDNPHQNVSNWGVSTELTADLGAIQLTVLPAYRETKLDQLFNGPAFKAAINREDSHQASLEARLSGTIGPVDWLAGGYYFDEGIKSNTGYNQYLIGSIQAFRTGTTSKAAFGRLTFHASDSLRFVGAARYTEDKKYFDGTILTLINLCTNAPPPAGPGCFGGPSQPSGASLGEIASQIPAALLPFGFPTAPGPADARPFGSQGNILFYVPLAIDQRIKNNRVTYRLSAEYDIGPRSLLYAGYETGYRSGGFNVALGRETFAPEYISAITIGSKNRFFDNRLQLNIEGFYWRYRNQQISHFGFDSAGGNTYFTENVGRSTIKGIDVDLQFKATPTTLLTGSVQYLDSKLNNFIYNSPRLSSSLPPAVGCPFTNGTEPDGAGGTRPVYVINCSGNPGFNSPKWAINAGVEQKIELGTYELIFNGSGRYRANRITGFDFLPQMNSGSDVSFDASLSFGPADEKWALTGWIRNLTNQTIPGTTQYAGTAGSVITTAYLPPRTYGLRARMNF